MTDSKYLEFANVIILNAVDDYVRALRYINKYKKGGKKCVELYALVAEMTPFNKNVGKKIKKIKYAIEEYYKNQGEIYDDEKFFRSEWCHLLSRGCINPDADIEHCRKKASGHKDIEGKYDDEE